MIAVKVKICGITNVEDALAAIEMGADLIGFNFYPQSKRYVTPDQARAIIDKLPTFVDIAGIFVNAAGEHVRAVAKMCSLNWVQLHGDETPDYCDDVLARTGRPVIKSFMASKLPDIRELSRYRTAGFFLFDLDKNIIENPPDEDIVHRMWDIAARKRRKGFRIILAGALDKENVNEAIRRTNAWGVDVCRGVEETPGVKDPKEIEQFVTEVRR